MMNLADQKELSELVLKAGPNGQTYVGPPGDARYGRRSHRDQCRREFVHDDLGRSRQRESLWHIGVCAVRKALIIDLVTHLC